MLRLFFIQLEDLWQANSSFVLELLRSKIRFSNLDHIYILLYPSDILFFGLTRMNSKSPIFTAQSDVALRIHVDRAVRHYFAQLQGEQPSQVYDMVLAEMEKPLLSVVLEYTRGNQTRAAEILGLNRGTLRKKLKAHGLMSE